MHAVRFAAARAQVHPQLVLRLRDAPGGALVLDGEDRSIRALESQLVSKVLEDTDWNISRAAAILGINRTTLYNKIRLYDLGKRPMRSKVLV